MTMAAVGRKNTPKGKGVHGKAKTPQMTKAKKVSMGSTPKSEPQPKRKKLQQEIEEELSDEDFEALLGGVRSKEKEKKLSGKVTPTKKGASDGEDDEDSSDDADYTLEDFGEDDSDMTDDDDDFEDEEEGDDDEDDDEDDEEEIERDTENKEKGKQKQQKGESKPKQEKAPGKKEKGKQKEQKAKLDKGKKEVTGEVHKDTLFIANLPPQSPDETRSELGKLCPKATWVYVPGRRRKNKKLIAKGYGLMKFENESQAKEGMRKLQGIKIGDRKITVTYSRTEPKDARNIPEPPEEERDPCRLYISGLGKTISEESMRKLFPTATRIDVPVRKKGKARIGYAFVVFSSAAECQKVHKNSQDASIDQNHIAVRFSKKRVEGGQKRKLPEGKNKKGEPASKKQKKTTAKKAKAKPQVEEDSDDEMADVDELESDDDLDDDDLDDGDDEEEGEEDDDDEDDDDDDDV